MSKPDPAPDTEAALDRLIAFRDNYADEGLVDETSGLSWADLDCLIATLRTAPAGDAPTPSVPRTRRTPARTQFRTRRTPRA